MAVLLSGPMFRPFRADSADRFRQPTHWLPGLVNEQKANWNMAIEIVDFPIKNGDFP
jgi:hypothetical protein